MFPVLLVSGPVPFGFSAEAEADDKVRVKRSEVGAAVLAVAVLQEDSASVRFGFTAHLVRCSRDRASSCDGLYPFMMVLAANSYCVSLPVCSQVLLLASAVLVSRNE